MNSQSVTCTTPSSEHTWMFFSGKPQWSSLQTQLSSPTQIYTPRSYLRAKTLNAWSCTVNEPLCSSISNEMAPYLYDGVIKRMVMTRTHDKTFYIYNFWIDNTTRVIISLYDGGTFTSRQYGMPEGWCLMWALLYGNLWSLL